MDAGGCSEAMIALNVIFGTALILNDGHEILACLEAGEDPVLHVGKKHHAEEHIQAFMKLKKSWPKLHFEAIDEMLKWALRKLDTDDRVTIEWKGDDQYHEIMTRMELRGNKLLIEFLHPPASLATG